MRLGTQYQGTTSEKSTSKTTTNISSGTTNEHVQSKNEQTRTALTNVARWKTRFVERYGKNMYRVICWLMYSVGWEENYYEWEIGKANKAKSRHTIAWSLIFLYF